MPPKRKRRASSRVSHRFKKVLPHSKPINDEVKPSKLSALHSLNVTEGSGNAMESDDDAVLTAESDEPLLNEEQLASLLNSDNVSTMFHRLPADNPVDIVGCPVSSEVVSSQHCLRPLHSADIPPVLLPNFPDGTVESEEQQKGGRQTLENTAITIQPLPASVSTASSLLTGVTPGLHSFQTPNPVNSTLTPVSTSLAPQMNKSCMQQRAVTTIQYSQLVDPHVSCSSTPNCMTRSQGASSTTLSDYSTASSLTVHEWPPLTPVQTTNMIKELTNRFNKMTTPANIAAIINYKKNPCVRLSGDIAMLLPYIMNPVMPNLCKCLICSTLKIV